MSNPNPSPSTRFKPGQSANPNGRPKGKTLKEFAREYLMGLPNDEKLAYLKSLPFEITWKMAEGNPKQDTDANVTVKLPEPIMDINDNEIPKDNSNKKDSSVKPKD